MIVRPKLFLDTNVLINAADGRIPCDEWTRVRQHINAHFQYCISSVTWKELIVGVARGDDAHFNKNKERLRVLCSLDSGAFLPYPPVFALRMVLGLHSAARTSETGNVSEEVWEEAVLKAVLAAPIKAQIKIDLNDIDKDENVPQNEHADLLQGIREGQIDKPSPRKWAAWILLQFGFTPFTDQCDKLVVALDAAYRFSCTLSRMSKDKGYDFHAPRHITDWGDASQLFYLCDQSMHFLTYDGNCRNHVKGSSQASRILLYREFVQSLPS